MPSLCLTVGQGHLLSPPALCPVHSVGPGCAAAGACGLPPGWALLGLQLQGTDGGTAQLSAASNSSC